MSYELKNNLNESIESRGHHAEEFAWYDKYRNKFCYVSYPNIVARSEHCKKKYNIIGFLNVLKILVVTLFCHNLVTSFTTKHFSFFKYSARMNTLNFLQGQKSIVEENSHDENLDDSTSTADENPQILSVLTIPAVLIDCKEKT